MLPEEMQDFISSVLDSVPELKKHTLSLHCIDNLGLGSAAALMGVKLGVRQIKLSSCAGKSRTLSLEGFLNIIKVRGESLGISYNVNDSALQRTGAELTALSKSRGEL
jgi:2-isopropylmalate synthase